MRARLQFAAQLSELERTALSTLDLVVDAIERTMRAVLEHDSELAGLVIAGDDRIDGRYLDVHQGLLSLLALQAPVATDLRLVAALLDVIRHAERMGDYCVNIAKLVPLERAGEGEGSQLVARIQDMGELAMLLVGQAKEAFARRDAALAEDLVARDDALDTLNRESFRLAVQVGDDPAGREWAMHMMLVARWIERIGDHAVDIGEEAAFVVTGEFREFTDASHPARSAPG